MSRIYVKRTIKNQTKTKMIKIFNKSELPWETTEYLDTVLKFLCEDTKM